MKIELKKISFSERMSEETNAFTADLYINGKNVGYCKNTGHGGCTDYHANTSCPSGFTRANIELIAEAEAYCKSLPKVKFGDSEWEQSLEGVIDQLLEDYLKAKEVKKMQKHMVNAILFGVPNGHSYTMIKYKQPLSTIPKAVLQAKVMNIQVNDCKNGVKILNTNLQELGIQV